MTQGAEEGRGRAARTLRVLGGTVAVLVAAGGTVLVVRGVGGDRPAPRAVAARPTASASSAVAAGVPAFHSVRTYQGVALPTRIRIPSIKVDSSLIGLGLAADGTIAAPAAWGQAAWYDGGPRPGQQGPAVIVGHVDSTAGPAVFYRLPQLKPGDAIFVDRADGSTVRFRVTGQQRVPKDRFPAQAVYSPTLQTSLLLITCGGSFNGSTGHYRDNVLVSSVPG